MSSLDLVALGVPTLIIADDPRLVAAAQAAYAHWLAQSPIPKPQIELRLEIGAAPSAEWVSLDVTVKGSCLQLRGRGSVGTANSVAGKGSAILAPELATDAAGFAEILDTLLLFLLTRAGRTPIHASAFVLGDLALVLAGPSGSGKSTLALAASRRGYPILSEDTLFVQREPSFALWGLPRPVHLSPSSAPEGQGEIRERNGKIKVVIPLTRFALCARRAALVLLERATSVALDPITGGEAVDRLMNLDAGFDLLEEESRQALDALASKGAWRLALSDDPNPAIDLLVSQFANARVQHKRGQGD
ncbi:MAG TPA: hypothetical protein VHS33_04360 [Sphingomicrobium sp.]|jgi:hypothetical protein|nr:hypothetical protein [Sphingomicrobium sp.]